MNKGTVMELRGRKAVVMTPDGRFVRVNVRDGAQVGEEISWSQADGGMGRRAAILRRSRLSAGLSAAALLILVFSLWSFRTPPVVAYVSMDVNPSVELGLDAKERVRELRAINEEAQPIVEGVAYKGKPIEQVAGALADKLADARLIESGEDIVIASVRVKQVDAAWETQVADKIEQALLQANADTAGNAGASGTLDIETLFLPIEVREEAKANGISAGKMAVWLAAENKGHDVPLESFREQSLGKIASSWGGIKPLLESNSSDKEDKKAWKDLLQEQKDKNKLPDRAKSSPPTQSGKDVEKGRSTSGGKSGEGQGGKKGDRQDAGKDKGQGHSQNPGSNKHPDHPGNGKGHGNGHDKGDWGKGRDQNQNQGNGHNTGDAKGDDPGAAGQTHSNRGNPANQNEGAVKGNKGNKDSKGYKDDKDDNGNNGNQGDDHGKNNR